MKCDDDATTTKRWVLLSPPDGFDVANTTLLAAYVLAMRGGRGGAPGGRVGGVLHTLLMVELGSPGFFQ
jgi:hypothetical protein